MADQIIRPSALPDRPSPVASEKVPVDNGSTVGGATIEALVLAGRPTASQVEAETGTNPTKAMTPLTTKQHVTARIGVDLASKAQGDKADTALQGIGAGSNITIDDTDPLNPIISASTAALPDGAVTRAKLSAALSESLAVSVIEYGAVADGTTDDSAAFIAAQAAAVASGQSAILVPAGAYRINATVDIVSGAVWIFEGASINTSQASLANGIFRANSVNDWAILGRLRLSGTRGNTVATPTTDTQHGLVIVNCDRYAVDGVIARNILGRGFYLSGSTTGDTSLRGDRGQFSNCSAVYCTFGRYLAAGAGAEYTAWSNWNASGNYVGDFIAAGNCTTVGGSVVDNNIGVQLRGGANHGHGVYSGTQINHNTTNIDANSVTNGYSFEGCHFYEGAILIENCAGIVLDGGFLDCPVVATTGAEHNWNYFRNMWCPGSYGAVVVSGTGNSHIILQALDGPGRPQGRISDGVIEVAAYRSPNSPQSLTSATEDTLLWSAAALNAGNCFSPATGIFTIPPDQGGVYEISWNLVFNGGGLDAAASYVSLQTDNSGGGTFSGLALSLGDLFGTSKIQFSGSAISSIAASSQVRLRASITGSSPTFGDSSGGWYCMLHIKKVG